MKPTELPNTRAITEADVVKMCVEHMHSLGWRPKRNHVGLFYTKNHTPISMGDKGEADWIFTHPSYPAIWVEFKKPGEAPRKDQLEFIAKLKYFGYKAGWADSFQSFLSLLTEWDIS